MRTRVHVIGQAHLDPAWLWRWTEGRAEALATSQSAVDRLEQFPDFHFTRGEAQVYQWIEAENPALFERIRELVRGGRWHVVNGMIVQPDMNLPQGESFVRHFLLGKSYLSERLGVDVEVAYCVDSFGHAATLPQIFQKCGCKYYVFMRPSPHELPPKMAENPSQVFWWQAPDGSRVLCFHITDSYATWNADQEGHVRRAAQLKPAALTDTMAFFGVGNHGGGPTIAQIENIRALQESAQDLEIIFSSPGAYFTAIEPQAQGLPVFAEELYYHAVGCYSSNSVLKRAHRQAECSLLLAERMACLARLWSGWEIPQTELSRLWHDLCFNQFHDILGGCTIKEAAEDAVKAFGGVIDGARRIVDDAGRAVAVQIDTRGAGGLLIIFNPFPYPRREYFEYEPWTVWQDWGLTGWGLEDETGQPIPWQAGEAGDALSLPSIIGISRVVFPVELPPLGYRLYRFAQGIPCPAIESHVEAGDHWLENELLRLEFDPASGDIVSCLEKSSGLELVGPGGWNAGLVMEDKSDTWGHGARRYDRLQGSFGEAHIMIGDQGPLQASLIVERKYQANTWQQEFILRQGLTEVLVRNRLSWQGRWQTIKLSFDVAVQDPQSFHDIPFGWCERPCDGNEHASQMWVALNGASSSRPEWQVGLALINDGKYGMDVNGSSIRQTILRSPPYAYHTPPHEFGAKRRYDWLDQGVQEFDLLLLPFTGGWREAGIVRRAREFNIPLVKVTSYSHPGDLPRQASLCELTSPEMEMTALKPAEDGNGFILRLADRHGRGAVGELRWLGEVFPVALASFEVRTLRLRRREGTWELGDANMLEASLEG